MHFFYASATIINLAWQQFLCRQDLTMLPSSADDEMGRSCSRLRAGRRWEFSTDSWVDNQSDANSPGRSRKDPCIHI